MRLVLAAVVILGAMGAFIWIGIVQASVPAFEPHEFLEKVHDGECRIDNGVLHSVDSLGPPLVITIRSKKDPSLLIQVETPRTPPDNLRPGETIVGLRGAWVPAKKRFLAHQITTSCPSKYEASKLEGAPKPGEKAAPALDPAGLRIYTEPVAPGKTS